MATTGYFEQQASGTAQQSRWVLRLEYSYDTNAAGTVTTITWTLKIYDGSGSSRVEDGSTYYWITAWSGDRHINYNYGSIGWYTLGSFTDTYSRTPGVERTITADAYWYSGNVGSSYTPLEISLSKPLTFPAVAGATTPTIGAVTLGSAATIGLPRASDTFTHTLTYKFGSASGTIATGAGASCTWTPPMSLANQIPTAVSGTGTITCTTYNGSTVIGTKTISFTASVPASVVPSIGACTVSPVNSNTWINGKGIYVAGYTEVKVVTTAAGAYGSTIKSIAITGIGTGSGTTWTSGTLSAGTKTITIKVTDSRGRTASTTRSITVQPYASPAISSLTYQRGTYSGGVWTANDNGEDIKVTFTLGLSLAAYSNVGSITASCTGEDNQTTANAAAGAKTYYFMIPLAGYKERFGDTPETEFTFYQTFLEQTDYVPAKLAEAAYLGKTVDPKYDVTLQYRQEAREAINALRGGGNDGKEA